MLSRRPPHYQAWLVLLAGLRFHARHPAQLLLTIAGIALGVAAVLAVDLASDSANRAFAATARLLRGQASHEIVRPGGLVPEAVLAALRREQGIAASAGVIEGRVRLADDPGRAYRLVGRDPFAATRVGARLAPFGDAALWRRLLATADAVLLPAPVAQALGLSAGDELVLADPWPGRRLPVLAVIDDDRQRLIHADLLTARELFAPGGGFSRIDLRIDERSAARLRPWLERQGLVLRSVPERLAQLTGMSRAFRVNLQALSLLTLVLGGFLVYSTVAFAVVRRREIFGLLRGLGLARRQLQLAVLAETAALALAGVALGLAGGIVLGSGLVRLVLRTISDLYLVAAVNEFTLSVAALAKAVMLGTGAALAAALLPATEAALTPPAEAMHRSAPLRRAPRRYRQLLLLALVGLAAAAALLATAPALPFAFAGLFLLLVALALAVPPALAPMLRGCGRLLARFGSLTGAWAARGAAAQLVRTGPAAAALMLAVATFSGIGLMIGSFRSSVGIWLDYSLDADLLLRLPAAPGVDEQSLLDELRELPGLAGWRLDRRRPLPDAAGLGSLRAVRSDPRHGRWPLSAVPRAELLRSLAAGPAVIVSESLASKRGLRAGDRLTLLTPSGARDFEVLAEFVDYSSDLGTVAMDLDVYRRYFGDRALDSVGLFARPGSEQQLARAAAELAARHRGMRVISTDFLRDISLAVFDRTFTITEVLRLIAGLVAVIAIVNALQAQRLDSARETAVMRALGLAPGQLLRLSLFQSGLLGACSGLLAVPVGLLLAWLLIAIVNRLAFGWSMGFAVDVGLLVDSVLLAALAGLLAGWWPARQALRWPPARGLREF